MFGVVHKLEPYTVTFVIYGCCTTKFQKVYLNGLTEPLELGMKVRYETEIATSSRLPKLATIRPEAFDNCKNCNISYKRSNTQQVNIQNICRKTNYY